MGMKKPQHGIYLAILKDLNCEPEESVFIDNELECVNAAKELGINAIHFKNPNQLKRELASLEIIVNS